MGNQPSVEQQPQRAPQKLSKPRVGNHAASTGNLLSPNTAASSTTRFSNSYLVGPPYAPAPSPESGVSPPVSSSGVAGEAIAEPPFDEGIEVKPKRKSGLFRSSTLQVDSTSKRKSSGLATSKTFDGINRPKSVVQRPDLSPLSPALGEQVNRRASHLDLSTGNPRALTPNSPKATSPVASDFNFDDAPEPARRDSNQQALDALIGRSQSDVSLYAPSRRRSAILTPGVATRSEQNETSLSKKKSFRKSLPANSRSRRGSHEPPPERPVSMFPSPPADDIPERLVTPSENDYKQLGGMKFGSLRITNGVPSPGPESGHSNKRNPLSIDKSSLSHVESPGEIKQPKPVSPLMATFSDASTVGLATSSEKEYSPFSAPTSGELTAESVSPGACSSDQTTPEENVEEAKAQDTTVAADGGPRRSDSGSGSATSSGSVEGSSKADSGYGSSLSLRSLFGSRKKSQRLKEVAKEQAESAPTPTLERRPTLKQNMAYQPLAKKASQTSLKAQATSGENDTPVETQDTPSRGGGLLGSFRARKAREEDKSKHSRGSSVPEAIARKVSVNKPTSSSGDSTGSQKTKKLQRLSDNIRRRSLPNMMPANEAHESVPSMPSDAGQKVQEHTRNFDMANKRFSLRLASEKDVLRPVVVASKEVTETPLHHVDSSKTSDLVEPVSPRPRSMTRPASAIFRTPSTNTNRRSILRKPRPAQDESNDSGDEEDLPDYILGVEAQAANIANIRRSAGNSAFDAAFVPMAEDHAMGNNTHQRARQSRSRPRTPDGHGPYPRLRSRSSAPDFLETVSEPASPGSISCYSQKKPKTPPPISIRTRGSKKKRRPKSRHLPPQQHPPMPGQFSIEGVHGGLDPELGQSLRSFPVSHPAIPQDPRNQLDFDVPYNRRASARPFYPPPSDQMGPYPNPPRAPAFHRPSPRSIDAGRHPHGRVLHSYNSPAYKGVPIWS